MNNELIREEIRKAILENWSSEIIAMLRSDLEGPESPFSKWWTSAPPYAKTKFLQRQFKLSPIAAKKIMQSLALEGNVNEFGERQVGRYRGSLDSFQLTSSSTGGLGGGYKVVSTASSDKGKIVRTARAIAKAKNMDTMAVQSRQGGQWRVYGKSAGNASRTSKYY